MVAVTMQSGSVKQALVSPTMTAIIKNVEKDFILRRQIYFKHCANNPSCARIFCKFAPLLIDFENQRHQKDESQYCDAGLL